jgi:hypothetical protein
MKLSSQYLFVNYKIKDILLNYVKKGNGLLGGKVFSAYKNSPKQNKPVGHLNKVSRLHTPTKVILN